MRRVPLVAMLALVFSSFTLAQVGPGQPGARPGVPAPGGQIPGLPPPRDANARAPQTGTSKVRGRVLASPSGAPLRRAQVSLTSAEPGQQTRRVTTTDGEGRYEFAELPAGRFSMSATKAGYVTLQYGQRRPFEAGTPLNISDAQTLERIDFGLPRGSVISVRINDEFGEPVAGVMVQVQRYQYGPDGQRRLSTVPGAATPFATTDDRGEFRAFGLMPGEYVVLATMRGLGAQTGSNPNDSNEGFSPTFYPGTISADQAQAISVGVGEEQAIAFSMIASRMGRVSGTVVDSEGQPAGGASLSIVTVTGTGYSSSSAGMVAPDGSFTVTGIAPGEHTLRVDRRRGTAAGEFASVPVTVTGNEVTGLRITLSAGTRVTGRVIWEGTSARTGGQLPPRVSAQQADPQRQFGVIGGSTDPLANGTPDDEGNFTLAGVSGRVFFTMTAPPAWAVKSVTLAGDDITDVPMDLTGVPSLSDLRIVLTDKLTSLTGQVLDQRGQPLKDYVVVILGALQQEPVIAARSTRVIRPDNTGRFQVRGMRPGRYVAAALEALEQGRQYAPEFQQQLRRVAREFSVGDGEAVTIDLRLTPDL